MAKEYTLLQTKVFTTRATGRMTGAILLSEVGSCFDIQFIICRVYCGSLYVVLVYRIPIWPLLHAS